MVHLWLSWFNYSNHDFCCSITTGMANFRMIYLQFVELCLPLEKSRERLFRVKYTRSRDFIHVLKCC